MPESIEFIADNKGLLPSSAIEQKTTRMMGIELETSEGLRTVRTEMLLNSRGVLTDHKPFCSNRVLHSMEPDISNRSARIYCGCHTTPRDNTQAQADYPPSAGRSCGLSTHGAYLFSSLRDELRHHRNTNRSLRDLVYTTLGDDWMRNTFTDAEVVRLLGATNFSTDEDLQVLRGIFQFEETDAWRAWNVGTDPTCGLELRSAPMRVDEPESWQSLQRVMDTMENDTPCEATSRCGTHVHLSASTMEEIHRNRLVAIYTFFEPIMGLAVSPNRGNRDSYNSPLSHSLGGGALPSGRINSNVNSGRSLCGSRGDWLNTVAFREHGTFEFRMFQGTLDYSELRNWITLLLRLYQSVEFGKSWNCSVRNIVPLNPDFTSIRAFMRLLDLNRSDIDDDLKDAREWFLDTCKDNWEVSWHQDISNRLGSLKQIRQTGRDDRTGNTIFVEAMARKTISWLNADDPEEAGRVLTRLIMAITQYSSMPTFTGPRSGTLGRDAASYIINNYFQSYSATTHGYVEEMFDGIDALDFEAVGNAALSLYEYQSRDTDRFIRLFDNMLGYFGRTQAHRNILSNFELSTGEQECVDFSA